MKAKTYIRLSLLFPFITWIILGIYVYVLSNLLTEYDPSPLVETITLPMFLYVFGIFIWGIPYTLLAIALGVWSRKQPSLKTAKVFAFSPLVLAILVIIQVTAIFLFTGDAVSPDFGAMALMLSIFSVVYGYALIGIVAGIYKLLNRMGYIKGGEEIPPMPVA